MGVEKLPARYVVYIQPGACVEDAVARHRERTGHGGTVWLVFLKSKRGG